VLLAGLKCDDPDRGFAAGFNRQHLDLSGGPRFQYFSRDFHARDISREVHQRPARAAVGPGLCAAGLRRGKICCESYSGHLAAVGNPSVPRHSYCNIQQVAKSLQQGALSQA